MANIEESGRLSDEDLELLALLATRPSDEAIARHLDISVRTVRRRVARIMEALDAPNRFAAGVAAASMGWVTYGLATSRGPAPQETPGWPEAAARAVKRSRAAIAPPTVARGKCSCKSLPVNLGA